MDGILPIAGYGAGWVLFGSLGWLIVSSFIRGKLPTPTEAENLRSERDLLRTQNQELLDQNIKVVYEVLPAVNALIDALKEAAER